MKSSDLAEIILKMRGRMPESSRYFLAIQIIEKIGLHLLKKGGTLLEEWQASGAADHFLASCQFTSGPPWVNHTISVHDTDLATFINRWMNVERIRRSNDGEWEPLTADQNDIRCKMVDELKAIWRTQSGSDEDLPDPQ